MTWTCVECTTVYSVGAPRCPHCGSTDYVESHMAKITVHGGPSDRRTASSEPEPAAAPESEAKPAPKPKPAPARRRRTQVREKD